MPLTVRLDDTLDAALARHCAATGASKSLVVQESIAAFLLARHPSPGDSARAAGPSRNLLAFERAGLVGALSGATPAGRGADKAAVRRRMAERLKT